MCKESISDQAHWNPFEQSLAWANMICFIVLCSEFKGLLFDVKLSPIQGKQLSYVSPFKSPSNSIGRLIGEV